MEPIVLVPTLAVRDLGVSYIVGAIERPVLRSFSFDIAPGESFGLVGESGCGKSTAAMSIVRHLAPNAQVRGGSVHLNGDDVFAMGRERLRHMRGQDVSVVYQEPGRALNPSMKIADQLDEVFRLSGLGREEAREQSKEMLTRVQISSPDRVLTSYPHQLSGGMQQRVVIAMALSTNPSLLILDEPTTALDATVGAEVLEIVSGLRQELGTSVLLISHNLALVSQMCDRVGVLYSGLLVDEGPSKRVFERPRHPYTAGLLECIPGPHHHKHKARLASIPGALPGPGEALIGCPFSSRCPLADDRCRTEEPPLVTLEDRQFRCFHHDKANLSVQALEEAPISAMYSVDYDRQPLLSIDGATKTYGRGEHAFRAVNDISLSLWTGETLGIVGESGSGKSTLARMIMGLVESDAGSAITVGGQTVQSGGRAHSADQNRSTQIVFQNPDAALNRRHSVRHILGRSITKLSGKPRKSLDGEVEKLAASFKLGPQHLSVRPMRLSGGLKQRVAIARAFAGNPALVVCDEPTSALDVSVQASILNLLMDLQSDTEVSYLFVTHDLGVVQYVADRIAVMYLGQVMEIGPSAKVLNGPHHPYTEVLQSAVSTMGTAQPERLRMQGEPPDARKPPTGCPFQTRCPVKIGKICEEERPALNVLSTGHAVRCHLPEAELPVRVLTPETPTHTPQLHEISTSKEK